MTDKPIMIIKASGQTEAFKIDKLEASLRNAGANEETIAMISADISSWISEGLSTRKIYARAYNLLKSINKTGASLYKLRNAIMEMGPSGHPFEVFIGEIFKRWGYAVKTAVVLQGASITHEMDVFAAKGDELSLAECKFSAKQGTSISIQVPLYVHSRVADIVEKYLEDDDNKATRYRTWIISNSRFTPDSIQYSQCKNIRLLGWDHPRDHGLKHIITEEKIFPVTVLNALVKSEKTALMARGIVTCLQLSQNPGELNRLAMNRKKQATVNKELENLLNS